MIEYFKNISVGKIVLWCYLIWYIVTVVFYFDPSFSIWLNSAGISAIIGVGLMLSIATPSDGKRDHWQTVRLFAMPFCVSSFSSLIKGKGYILIIPPALKVLAVAVGACVLFISFVCCLKALHQKQ